MKEKVILHFHKAGLHTTIQDKGRYGYQQFGVPVGGAMDQTALQVANTLVGNPPYGPALEITLIGPKVSFQGRALIALAGANLRPQLNGVDIPMYRTIKVRNGDVLSFKGPHSGCRSYLAISGYWRVKSWLGSYSAASVNTTQLTPDSLIKKGDHLIIESTDSKALIKYQKEENKAFSDISIVEVAAAPEFQHFSAYAIASFFSTIFSIHPQSNRMGYRLNEKVAGIQPKRELISSGVLPGTIQITKSGQPIILMRDAQTSGGYHRMVKVLEAQLDLLAQLKPGDQLRFKIVG